MTTTTERFAPFAEKMTAEDLPDVVVSTFGFYYSELLQGATGLIPEASILPVDTLPDAETLPAQYTESGKAALSHTVLIKLNGGLGTSMGLSKAKSLLPIKNGLSFLDIIARQALATEMPLVLMDSYNTSADSLAALRAYPQLWSDIPLDFLQHKVPKVAQADLSPVAWPANPELEWNPPGHGDIYTALLTSGQLDILLDRGYKYAFVSNADNLGAVMDTAILGYFVESELPFLMEAADRTLADRKGGHLARLASGQLILRESAQCPSEDEMDFQDISRHHYFNTNSLWLDLALLKKVLEEKQGVLGLPLIRNQKTLDPRDPRSPLVYQLETAMGSAISVFEGAGAIRVLRSRFAPVKTTNDLLAIRSDAYVLSDDYRVIPNPARSRGELLVDLDAKHYKLVDDLDSRFPFGAPSLLRCDSLTVQGDVRFGQEVVCMGSVNMYNLTNQQKLIDDFAHFGR